MVYTDYAAYNLRPYFDKQPGQPTRCLMCGGHLTRSKIDPSKTVHDDLHYFSLIPVHDFSYLFICDDCQWWCIRESWTLCEVMNELDFIIISVPSSEKMNSVTAWVQGTPWLKALADGQIYFRAQPMTPEIAKIFPVSS